MLKTLAPISGSPDPAPVKLPAPSIPKAPMPPPGRRRGLALQLLMSRGAGRAGRARRTGTSANRTANFYNRGQK